MDGFRQASALALLIVALGLLTSAGALAQPGASARPALRVGRLQGEIRLDGVLDEPAWAGAESITGLTQIEPTEGGEPTAPTVVKVLADSRQLVFGILAFDPDPSAIVAFATRRDAALRNEDHIRIVLDPFLDGRSGVVFVVNPNGARYDALVSNRGEGENSDWDQTWDAKTMRTDDGWQAEIWIPIRSLTFKPGLRSWGLRHFRLRTGAGRGSDPLLQPAHRPVAGPGGTHRRGRETDGPNW